jgi:archaellum component FlaC
MALYPNVLTEHSKKIAEVSDEIGRLTRIITQAVSDGDPSTPIDEHRDRLRSLEKELEKLVKEHEELSRGADSQ